MDGQLEAVRQDIRSVQERIIKYEQDLAAAKEARNGEQERLLFQLLVGLQEEKNILLRGQAPGKHCLELVMYLTNLCFHHVPLHSVNDSILWVLLLHMIQKGCLSRLV